MPVSINGDGAMSGVTARTSNIFPNSVTAAVSTNQTTTSATFTDLATVGPTVTLITGTKALVIISASIYNSGASGSEAGFAVSGASTLAAASATALYMGGSNAVVSMGSSRIVLVTGLTSGSNTFTIKYRAGGGTANFYNREITVIDMGS